MKKSHQNSIYLLALLWLQGCVTHFDPVMLPQGPLPYQVFSSPENLNSMTEIGAGEHLLANSQVYLYAKQEIGAAGWMGGIPTMSPKMDTGSERLKNETRDLSIKFDGILKDLLSALSQPSTFQVVEESTQADIILLPSAKLYHIGNGVSQFEFNLAARYKDPNGKISRRYFVWLNEDSMPLIGEESWSDKKGLNLNSRVKTVLPLLLKAFFMDLKLDLGNSVDPLKHREIWFQRSDMDEPRNGYVLSEFDEVLLIAPTMNGKPIRSTLYIFPKSLLVSHRSH